MFKILQNFENAMFQEQNKLSFKNKISFHHYFFDNL